MFLVLQIIFVRDVVRSLHLLLSLIVFFYFLPSNCSQQGEVCLQRYEGRIQDLDAFSGQYLERVNTETERGRQIYRFTDRVPLQNSLAMCVIGSSDMEKFKSFQLYWLLHKAHYFACEMSRLEYEGLQLVEGLWADSCNPDSGFLQLGITANAGRLACAQILVLERELVSRGHAIPKRDIVGPFGFVFDRQADSVVGQNWRPVLCEDQLCLQSMVEVKADQQE